MTCLSREELTLRRTAPSPVPEYSAAELDHIGHCSGCRSLASEVTDAAAGITRASAEREPDARYWTTIVPRVRERARGGATGFARGGIAGFARILMPVAAVAAMAIALAVTAIEPPLRLSGGQLLATLSDIELQELRQSGAFTNLLDSQGWNGGAQTSLAELIADLLLEDEEGGLDAIADPEEVLQAVDDGDLAEIVSNLDYH